jgi:hypothetical protein
VYAKVFFVCSTGGGSSARMPAGDLGVQANSKAMWAKAEGWGGCWNSWIWLSPHGIRTDLYVQSLVQCYILVQKSRLFTAAEDHGIAFIRNVLRGVLPWSLKYVTTLTSG